MIRLLAHPLPHSHVRKLSLFLRLPVCHRSREGKEWWGRSQLIRPREKAWPSINHSILSDLHVCCVITLEHKKAKMQECCNAVYFFLCAMTQYDIPLLFPEVYTLKGQ
jgi:hypothetical protein